MRHHTRAARKNIVLWNELADLDMRRLRTQRRGVCVSPDGHDNLFRGIGTAGDGVPQQLTRAFAGVPDGSERNINASVDRIARGRVGKTGRARPDGDGGRQVFRRRDL